MSDKDTLVGMGFSQLRSEAAVKATKGAGLQAALDWLIAHEDQTDDDIAAAATTTTTTDKVGNDDDDDDDSENLARIAATGEAKSLKCMQCGKIFKNTALASYHGDKSGHDQFEESTEEVKPLTEDEKADRLAQLKAKMAEKKAANARKEAEENKQNEAIRRKAGKDTAQLKAEIQAKEAEKEAAQRRKDKIEDAKARAAVKAQIEADKKARAEKAAREKALREGKPLPGSSSSSSEAATGPTTNASQAASAPSKANHAQARLQIRLPTGGQPLLHTVSSTATLAEVADHVRSQAGIANPTFSLTFPRKQFTGADLNKTVAELGLTPSAVLMVLS